MDKDIAESEIQNLIRQAQEGDVGAFGAIYDIFVDRIYRFVYLRVGHKETAEDLTATVFLKTWEHLGNYRQSAKAKFSTWLFTVAHRTVIDYYRTRKERSHLALESLSRKNMPFTKGDVEAIERSAVLDWALDELTEDQRSILILNVREGFSLKEIAEMMGKSPIRVRVIKYRALRKLRSLFQSLESAY